jgi:hypothetical protein
MDEAGYPPAAINVVVRALFVSSSRTDLRACFELLDRDRSGKLDVHEFKQLLFVCGEQQLAGEGKPGDDGRAPKVEPSIA